MFNRTSRPVAALGLAAALAAFALAMRTPAFSESDPQRVNVVYKRDLTQASSLFAVDASWGSQPWGEPPQAMKNALGNDATNASLQPWSSQLVLEANVQVSTDEPLPPKIDSKSEERNPASRVVHLHIVPPPGARSVSLAVRDTSALTSAQVQGRDWPQAYLGSGESRWRVLTLRAPSPRGFDVTLSIAGTLPLEARLQSVSSGVPSTAARIVQSRPPQAAASQDGDFTLVVSPQSL